VTDPQRDAVELWPVYDEVFGDHPDFDSWREAVWDKHVARPGFRLVRAHQDGELVGFAYGYVGHQGQWWTDQARQSLGSELAAAWLGGHFEVVSLGVLDRARGKGLGRALLRELCNGPGTERCLLMTTSDASDPARRLYASEGWQVIGPGVGDETVIMARGRPRTAVG